MGEIVVVRHGETSWSLAGRHTGLTDVPLTPTGERQAGAVGALLRGQTFAVVVTSPLGRARRTAEIAGYTDPQVDPDLVEWDYGGYEGLTTLEIRARVGRPWTIFADGVTPGDTPGETLAAVGARADRIIARLSPHLDEGDVLLFSHAHLLRVLAARWVGEAPTFGARLALATATISRLGTEHDLPVVQEWNRQPD
jgi:broad specificity phosphatase PhoE